MQPCRYCYKEVDPQARRCPYCRSDLTFLGRVGLMQPVASVLIAVGGFVYGVYERIEAKKSRGELEMEQAALVKVLQSGLTEKLAARYGDDTATVEQLKQELRRNPKNVDARIRLRMKQHARTPAGGRSKIVRKPRNGSPLR
jgi:hypothetical protein